MSYDFIIVGGGHHALACGAYLARAGAKVVVLERSHRTGGACHTEEVTLPGFKHSVEPMVTWPADSCTCPWTPSSGR